MIVIAAQSINHATRAEKPFQAESTVARASILGRRPNQTFLVAMAAVTQPQSVSPLSVFTRNPSETRPYQALLHGAQRFMRGDGEEFCPTKFPLF